jgi:dipeptidyl-peptidase-4
LTLIAALGLFCSLADEPKTTAEATEYRETTKYADVVALGEQLAKHSPTVKLSELGVSHEGRKLPLWIIADPPVENAEAAKRSGKLVMFVIANIHAGEVDGKEGLMAFARDLAFEREKPLFEHLVFVFAPIFNADGNEKLGANRPGQAGPPIVGTRANAQNFDLNRDFVKLETPEVRALVKALNEWDPAVFMDLHTTNGSFHRYTLTFEGGGCPAGDSQLIDFTRTNLLPTVSRKMEAATGFKSTFYGNFNRDRSKWETVPPTPRYGFHYAGLRNRLSVLSESYSYAPFPERVRASKAFVREVAAFTAENRKTIGDMLASARSEDLREPKEDDTIVLRHREAPTEGPKAILGFVEETKDGKRRPTKEPKEYPVVYTGGAEPTLKVPRPFAYAMPKSKAVVETLERHGILFEELTAAKERDVEVHCIDKIVRGRAFQGHQPTTVEATTRREKRTLPAGTVVVHTNQRLGRLAAYLLEPRAMDGLVQWNFFDDAMKEGEDFPVLRVVTKP